MDNIKKRWVIIITLACLVMLAVVYVLFDESAYEIRMGHMDQSGGVDELLAMESPSRLPHYWTTAFPPLVAHAGGGLRHASGTLTYTNSIEALIQNYELGHRVFEFDLILTSDYKLAAVHDWHNFGTYDDMPMSETEWRGYVPENEVYKTVMFGDILNVMLEKTDLYIITDTKSSSLTDEETLLQFYNLYHETVKRDPTLLSRIIPQVYNEAMYDLIAQVFAYPSIIFTLYDTNASEDEILAFVQSHDSIKVVTMPAVRGYIETDLPKQLAALGKIVYVHTVNDFEEIIPLSKKGASGFYTDFITPESFKVYQEIMEAG